MKKQSTRLVIIHDCRMASGTPKALLVEVPSTKGFITHEWFPRSRCYMRNAGGGVIVGSEIWGGYPQPFDLITEEWLAVQHNAKFELLQEEWPARVPGAAAEAAQTPPIAPVPTPSAEAQEQECIDRLEESERRRKHDEAERGRGIEGIERRRFVLDNPQYVLDTDCLCADAEE